MATTWTSASTFLPPSYDEATAQINEVPTGGELTFVDFLPNCRTGGGFFTQPTFDSFRALIDQGNEWLRTHPRWQARTCESVEFRLKSEDVNTQKMTYLERGDYITHFIRGLRLWITPNTKNRETAQQIGYMNLVPERRSDGGFFGTPTYESLSELLNRFNEMIRSNPVPGKIITVETQEMKAKSSTFDPDCSNWRESGEINKHFVFILRIFFEITSSTSEAIGLTDFIPEKFEEGGLFSMPKYEPFSNVIAKASQWCSQQDNIRICNAQSVEIKLKSGHEIDLQNMGYTEHGSRTTYYIRILRIAYAKNPEAMNQTKWQGILNSDYEQNSRIHQLTCRTFIPLQLTSGLFVPDFETLDQTKNRVEMWIKATGAQVINAETVAMRLFTGGEARAGVEASFTYNRSERDEYWIYVIRLHLNGFYHEPPQELLPPIPEIQGTLCCTIV